MTPLYVNTVLIFVFLIYLIYTKRPMITKVLVSFWLVSFVSACIYAQFGLLGMIDIKNTSLVYFDACILIYLYPLIVNEKSLSCDMTEDAVRVSERLLLVLGLLFTVPFIENVVQFISTFTEPTDSILDVYSDKMDVENTQEIVTWLDPVSLQITNTFGRFNRISILLLFLIFTKKNKVSYKNYLLYFIAVFTPILVDINTSGRGAFAFFIISIIVLFFMFKNNLTIKIPKSLITMAVAIIGICVIGIVVISSIRSDAYNAEGWVWTSLYFGEGPVRFLDQMWNIKCSTLGDNSFSFFKSMLGFDTVTDSLMRRQVWHEGITGVDPIRFYTFIGDWFSDLGINLTLPFIALLSFIVNRYLKKDNHGLVGVFLVYTYIYIFATGYTYYCFKAHYGQYSVVFSVIILYIISKFRIKHI